jgi:tol-pal system beta propeller repeat protein TolB
MIYRLLILGSFLIQALHTPLLAYEEIFEVSSANSRISKMLITPIGNQKELETFAHVLAEDFNFTDQIEATVENTKKSFSKQELEEQFTQGVPLLCSISVNKKRTDEVDLGLEIKMLSTQTHKTIYEQDFVASKTALRAKAHELSSNLLGVLTGQKGIAASRLTYCKVLGKNRKAIFVSDYDAKNEQTIVASKALNVVPVWHSTMPIIFYSQLTNQNNRLMAANVATKQSKIVSSFDGLNMQPSVSKDGKRVALCLSRSGCSEIYLYDQETSQAKGKRFFKQLTNNKGTNVSPCLLENDDVIFASDFETRYPQIYYLDQKKRTTIRLTTEGDYCAAPAYCERTKQLYYMRPVDNTFQLFRKDLSAGLHSREEQITFSPGDKYNPAPSSCGRYIAFSYRHPHQKAGKVAQIAVFNVLSHKIRVLTTSPELKSNPSWQPTQNA